MRFVKLSIYVFLILNLMVLNAFSAKYYIKGIVVDESGKTLSGASVSISKDKKLVKGEFTDHKGKFSFDSINSGKYQFKITFLGYNTYEQDIELKKDLNLNEIKVTQSAVMKNELEVTAQAPAATINKDTTEFNAAAYKVAANSDAEDLVKKMPGVTVGSDGTVTAQGEQVKKVLVDGKEFFGSDPTIAMKNLPSEIIDKVQIYDKMSTQAEFTGFDDGNATKTMNIITKKNSRDGYFGKISAGGGDENKYLGKLNLNIFNGTRRLSIIGLSNNVNQQNFSHEDLIGAIGGSSGGGGGGGMMRMMGRGGSGGAAMTQSFNMSSSMRASSGMPGGPLSDYMVGQTEGINTTHSFGFNYTESWLDAIQLSANYFFNYSNNDSKQLLDRTYYMDTLTNQFYSQDGLGLTDNYNHRLNMEFNWVIDSSNTLNIKPKLSYQLNKANSSSFSENLFRNKIGNQSNYKYNSDSWAINFTNEIDYRLKLNEVGRTLSFNVTTRINDKEADNNTNSLTSFYQYSGSDTDPIIFNDSLLQTSNYPINNQTLSGNVTYTEPIAKNSLLSLTYFGSINKSEADKQTFSTDTLSNTQTLDSNYSNSFTNDYVTHRIGAGYRYKDDAMNLSVNVNYQTTSFKNNQILPFSFKDEYKFDNILPSVRLNYKFSITQNLNFFYNARTNIPSVEQLQNVMDISNPLYYSKGNSNLDQELSHYFNFRYSDANPLASNMFFSLLSINFKNNHIANATFNKDTVIDNIPIKNGITFTQPVNMDGYYNMFSVVTYGFPIDFISSNINLSLGMGYTRTPGMYNNLKYFTNTYNGNFILGLGSNISENLDFNLGARTTLYLSQNSLGNSQNQKYINQGINFKLNYTIWEGIFLQGEINSNIYKGLNDDYSQSVNLLNLSLGKKFFPDNRLEVKLSANDLLNQNQAINRTVNELYIENSNTKVLQRYFLLTVTYSLRNFSGMMPGNNLMPGMRPFGGRPD